ncbi:MAG TPA: DUF4194 domain-containing protein [Ignavibacteriales bacterium]|nr:DUF4194 domain-containing protein [Ignavibacteriales bacterium]
MNDIINIPPYAAVLIKLLQGIIYSDDKELWYLLINYQAKVREYFNMIGVELNIYESDGFAFLKQRQLPEEMHLPALISRYQLSYPVTLLCVLLLEKLIEFETFSGETNRLFVTRQEIIDMISVFLSERTNEARVVDSIDAHINKLVNYGFLKKMPEQDKFEVKRILKAKITADNLVTLKKQLEEYAGNI